MPDQPTQPHAAAARTQAGPSSSASSVAPPFGEIEWAEITPPSTAPDGDADSGVRPRGRRTPRTDWRQGGRTVLRWREWLLAASLIALGAGVLAATVLSLLQPTGWAAVAVSLVPLVAMLVPVVWAFSLSRPAGLLRLRGIDLLYAVAFGAALRIAQGWISTAAGESGAFPSYLRIDGGVSMQTWIGDVLIPTTVAPVVEELFFRGVLLVSVYTLLRRPLGKLTAGIAAVAVSVGAFVVVHGFAVEAGAGGIVATGLLGLVCALLVILTGRIWGAILVHVVYNTTFVALSLIGTFWA